VAILTWLYSVMEAPIQWKDLTNHKVKVCWVFLLLDDIKTVCSKLCLCQRNAQTYIYINWIYAGEIFSELISSVEMLGGKYSVLYVSDPFRSIHLPYHRELERFLAESAAGNASLNSTHCDEVCQIKSSLLEGVLVVSFHVSLSSVSFIHDSAFFLPRV
jgi:hypothetical protein